MCPPPQTLGSACPCHITAVPRDVGVASRSLQLLDLVSLHSLLGSWVVLTAHYPAGEIEVTRPPDPLWWAWWASGFSQASPWPHPPLPTTTPVPCRSPWCRRAQLGRIKALDRPPFAQLLVWKLITWAALAPLGLLPTPLGWIHCFASMPIWVPGVEGTARRSQGALWWPQAQQAPAVPRSRTW